MRHRDVSDLSSILQFRGEGVNVARARAHHYVPQAYLRRWGSEGRVAVRRRGSAAPFVASTKRVAQETDLYTLDADGEPSDQLERDLARFDAELPEMLGALAEGAIPRRGSRERLLYSFLLAIQFLRTPDHQELETLPYEALRFAGEWPVPRPAIEQFLTERAGYVPSPSEVQGAWDFVNFMTKDGQRLGRNEWLEIQFAALPRITASLNELSWAVEIAHDGAFLTSDQPLTLWHPKPRPYMGIGLLDAKEVRFPLGPRHLLVLRPRHRETRLFIDLDRVECANQHLAAASRKMIIGRIEDETLLASVPLRDLRPMMKFNSGPSVIVEQDGTERPGGEILHMFRPYDDREASEYPV